MKISDNLKYFFQFKFCLSSNIDNHLPLTTFPLTEMPQNILPWLSQHLECVHLPDKLPLAFYFQLHHVIYSESEGRNSNLPECVISLCVLLFWKLQVVLHIYFCACHPTKYSILFFFFSILEKIKKRCVYLIDILISGQRHLFKLKGWCYWEGLRGSHIRRNDSGREKIKTR